MAHMTSYEPDPKTAQIFARYKRAHETERELKPGMRDAAANAIRAGASNQELAALTDLTSEFFRKLAIEIGVDNRRKAPTVGREAEARRAVTPTPPAPAPVAPPRAAAPLLGMSEAPPELMLAAVVERMSVKAAGFLVKQAERAQPQWVAEQRNRFAEVDPRWRSHALLQAALNAGYVELPDN